MWLSCPQDRWEKEESDYFSGAPDLVTEVLSASNTMDENPETSGHLPVERVRRVLDRRSKRSLVLVTTPDRKTLTFVRSTSVPLLESLGGTIPVAAIFA